MAPRKQYIDEEGLASWIEEGVVKSIAHSKWFLLVLFAGTASASPNVLAYDDDVLQEEVVVIGTRRKARSVYDSAVPIAVLDEDNFRNQGISDLSDLIRNVVPSYNVNAQPISDGATISRPANMRGLAPEHTLVLVNGKRRHRSSIITWSANGVADGAQGPDISAIPAIALKQVEVLRDGASAQYGSDAIAGVMNFILKDSSEGGVLEAKFGEYREGQEAVWSIAGNIGLPFTSDGFVNLSFEYGEQDPTSRTVTRNDVLQLMAAGNSAVLNPPQVWGSPEIRDDLKTVWNLAVQTSDKSEFYLYGNYASKEVEGGFYFRNPDSRSGVYSPDRGETRLVADLTENGRGNCSVVSTKNRQALGTLIANPNCFVFNEMFPGGFTPSFGAETVDFSTFLGVRGHFVSGLNYDVSASVGISDTDFFISNTVNASMGPQSPTSFNPGDYTQIETNFNTDLSYAVPVAFFASDLNVAGGFEWHNEEFEITAGEQASWEIGPLADQGFTPASNGFPGFSPLAAGNWNRSNVALYLDLEADVTDRWLLGLAMRWEDFEDFGTTTNGKVATHFTVSESIGIRGSYSTGFRAPTPGQSNAFNISTVFDTSIGDLQNNGTIPSVNPVAKLRGGQPLDAEDSTNYTFGVVLRAGNFDLTVDYFNIEMKDRLAISRLYELTDNERSDLIEAGIISAATIENFQFFTNEIDTTTQGIDVIGTWSNDWSAGITDVQLAYNRTETEVDSGVTENIDEDRIREIEKALPNWRANLGVNHRYNNWRFTARYNHYNDWYDSEDGVTYDGYGTLDAEVAYAFESGLSLVLGSNNITDKTPDENSGAAAGAGNRYSQFAPGGFNGSFWYARAIYDF